MKGIVKKPCRERTFDIREKGVRIAGLHEHSVAGFCKKKRR